jgi:hypothetical protein
MTVPTLHGFGRSFRFAFAVFLIAFYVSVSHSQTTPPPIQVELNPQKPLHLRVTLRSGAVTRATFYRFQLPWGSRRSLIFRAVKPDGQSIDLWPPIGEDLPDKVSVEPGATLVGDIDLHDLIRDLRVTKSSDLHLFWAYKAPDELNIPRWSGGWVFIPRQR